MFMWWEARRSVLEFFSWLMFFSGFLLTPLFSSIFVLLFHCHLLGSFRACVSGQMRYVFGGGCVRWQQPWGIRIPCLLLLQGNWKCWHGRRHTMVSILFLLISVDSVTSGLGSLQLSTWLVQIWGAGTSGKFMWLPIGPPHCIVLMTTYINL